MLYGLLHKSRISWADLIEVLTRLRGFEETGANARGDSLKLHLDRIRQKGCFETKFCQ